MTRRLFSRLRFRSLAPGSRALLLRRRSLFRLLRKFEAALSAFSIFQIPFSSDLYRWGARRNRLQ